MCSVELPLTLSLSPRAGCSRTSSAVDQREVDAESTVAVVKAVDWMLEGRGLDEQERTAVAKECVAKVVEELRVDRELDIDSAVDRFLASKIPPPPPRRESSKGSRELPPRERSSSYRRSRSRSPLPRRRRSPSGSESDRRYYRRSVSRARRSRSRSSSVVSELRPLLSKQTAALEAVLQALTHQAPAAQGERKGGFGSGARVVL